jgi:predicted nucleotidyltransferase
LRESIAGQAARLLYYGLVEEYIQAKERAADMMGVKLLPSNREVAFKLDELADEVEGSSRKKLIELLRKEAKEIMGVLEEYKPRLIGSVWRGTARKGSDIDISVFSLKPEEVYRRIKAKYPVLNTSETIKTGKEGLKRYYHIYVASPTGKEIEIVVRDPEDAYKKRRCETYGDIISGLTMSQLKKILHTNPLQKFV